MRFLTYVLNDKKYEPRRHEGMKKIMSSFEIRQLVKEDAEAYRDIRLEMLQNSVESFGDSYEGNLKHDISFFQDRIKNCPIYGGFKNNNLVGVAGYFIRKGEKMAHKAMIWGVYVQPTSRGKNISKILIEKAIEGCSRYVEQVLIHASASNIIALKIYASLGFKEFGREPKARKVNGQYYDEILMVKFLK